MVLLSLVSTIPAEELEQKISNIIPNLLLDEKKWLRKECIGSRIDQQPDQAAANTVTKK